MNEFLASAHPFIVHFAVALVMMSAVFELLALASGRKHFETTALTVAIAAVPFLLAAVLTGNLAESFLDSALRGPALDQHMLLANITVWTFTALAFGRVYTGFKGMYGKALRVLYIVLLCAAAAVTFFAALEGGEIYHGPRTETRG